MTLAELQTGQFAEVHDLQPGQFGAGLTTRLQAIGVVPGKPIQVLQKAWLGGPLQVRVGSTTEIAIRRHEAALITVNLVNEADFVGAVS